jgi:hypothetical protein
VTAEEPLPPTTAQSAFAAALALIARERPKGPDAARPPAFSFHPPDPVVATVDGGGPSPGGGLIADAQRRIAAGDLTATELVEQAIVAAEKQGMALGAIVELMADSARAEAARLDRLAAAGGPLGRCTASRSP